MGAASITAGEGVLLHDTSRNGEAAAGESVLFGENRTLGVLHFFNKKANVSALRKQQQHWSQESLKI